MKSQFLSVLQSTLTTGKSNELSNDLTPFEGKIIFYLKNGDRETLIVSPNNSTLCASPKQL